MKKLQILLALLLPLCSLNAQELPDSLLYNNEYLDTVQVYSVHEINNYCLVGFSYGGVLSRMTVTPYQHQDNIWNMGHYAVTFTRYEKMFDYLPYFGFQTGLELSYEGMQFKYNEETGYMPYWDDGTSYIKMRTLEIPVLAQLHLDAPPVKFMASFGFYGAYRLDMDRQGEYVSEDMRHTFQDYEIRWDYGLEGGLGIAYMLDPLEFHLGAAVRYSWGSLFEPDYNSEYYYRYCYPLDIMITFGVHFQITKRTGKTTAALRKEAKKQVYGE